MVVLVAMSEMGVIAARLAPVLPRKYLFVVLSNAGSAGLRVTLTRWVGEIVAGPKVPVKAAGALTVYEPPVYARSLGPIPVIENVLAPADATSEMRTLSVSGPTVPVAAPMLTTVLTSKTGPAG